jgi:hypothetical protein
MKKEEHRLNGNVSFATVLDEKRFNKMKLHCCVEGTTIREWLRAMVDTLPDREVKLLSK